MKKVYLQLGCLSAVMWEMFTVAIFDWELGSIITLVAMSLQVIMAKLLKF